jgi:hypothetical protein
MPKIIFLEFNNKDFIQLVDAFLFLDDKNLHHTGSLITLREHLVQWGEPFQKVIQAYFERKDNVRYDNMIVRMDEFANKLQEYIAHVTGEEKKAFILFWNGIADYLTGDYTQLQDQYLKNNCKYFISEIAKLS